MADGQAAREVETSVPSGAAEARTAILVAGMHRSGTSALTRVLNLAGCDLAPNLIDPDRFNERGYWEAPEIFALNDEVLASADSSWLDWRPLRSAWRDNPARASFEARAVETLEKLFAKSPLFVLKDPRICRLMPFWRGALDAAGIDLRVIIPIREPVEVAASLLRRNGMNPAIAQLLWLRHVLEAEAASRDVPRAILEYRDLTSDWRGTLDRIAGATGLDWPRDLEEAAPEIDGFIAPELRHHTASAAETLIDAHPLDAPWISETLSALRSGASTPEQHARLDRVLTDFDRASRAFGRPIAEIESHARLLKDEGDRLLSEIVRRDDEIARIRDENARIKDEFARVVTEKADAEATLTAREAQVAQLGAERDDLAELVEAERATADRALAELSLEIGSLKADMEAERAEGRRKLLVLHTVLTEAGRSLSLSNAELEDFRQRLHAIERSFVWRMVTAPIQLTRKVLQGYRHWTTTTKLGGSFEKRRKRASRLIRGKSSTGSAS